MYNDFIPKAGLKSALLLSLFALSACQPQSSPAGVSALAAKTGNALQHVQLTPSGAGPGPLEHVSLANSRDLVVGLKPGTRPDALRTLFPIQNVHALSEGAGIYRLQIPTGVSLRQSLSQAQASGLVRYAEPNLSFSLPKLQGFQTQSLSPVQPNDPNYGLQWNIKSSKVDQAWSLVDSNPDLTVAVIDSGVDPNHPDLFDNLLPLEDIQNEEKGVDIYRNPFTSEVINFGGKDGNGHGTHVTGIIAASLNNNIGVAGVAGGGIKILPIKATDFAGNTDAATLTAAFQRAIDKGADVINISIGGPASKTTQALTDVIRLALQRNIPIISATGNESDRSSGFVSPVTVPAAYSGVIAVGAHTEFDKVATYSNGGPQVDILAPGGGGRSRARQEGQQVWSVWPSYFTFEFFQKRITSTNYAATSGTSMACPHVTGVVALMLAREPQLTPSQIRSRLIATADDLNTPGFDEESGYGKLNALRALQWTGHDAHD